MQTDQLTLREHEKYKKMWASGYGEYSPGLEAVPEADEFFQWCIAKGQILRPDSLIDFGCGECKALNAFWNKGYTPCYGVDIVAVTPQVIQACLWNLPDDLPRASFGFCSDVMEHIPPEKVRQVFEQINNKVDAAYFRIATIPDSTGRDIGEVLHMTVGPLSYWISIMREVFGASRVGLIRKHASYVVIGVRREQ